MVNSYSSLQYSSCCCWLPPPGKVPLASLAVLAGIASVHMYRVGL